MNPGDVPRFEPGLFNPADRLNELADQAGRALGMKVAPPLVLENGPVGLLLRLDAVAAPASDVRIAKVVVGDAETPPAGYLSGQLVNFDPSTDPPTITDDVFVWLYDMNG